MRYLFILFALVLFVQCKDDQRNFGFAKTKQSSSSHDFYVEEQSEMSTSTVDGSFQGRPQSLNQPANRANQQVSKIIKKGNLNFDVDNLDNSKKIVDQFLKSVNAYYEDENYSSSSYSNTYSLSIRVPSQQFDTLVYLLESGTGKLKFKNITAQDVSEEYVDLQIRLKNNLAYLNQYKEILKKATTIKDILKVQEHIRNLEMEIESKKGRIQFLDNRVSYGTLQVEISQKLDYVANGRSFTSKIVKAFKNGSKAFLNFIIVIVTLWPFLLLVVGIIIFRKKIFTVFKRSKS